MLVIENLTCGYGKSIILRNINLKVNTGEFIGIIGPNGSGKTTLIRAITKILKLKEGSIVFKDKDLRDISHQELAKKIAVVSQDIEIVSGLKVEEYILLGRIPHRRRFQFLEDENDIKIAQKAMDITDILKVSMRYIDELSSGEKQRVLIGRALCQEPLLLLLDEPTSHLDIGHQIELMELVKSLNRKTGLTVIVILHDLNLASSYCDRLILMNEGSICKDDKPEGVLTYQNIEEVYKTVVVVEKSSITKKPYIYVVPKQL